MDIEVELYKICESLDELSKRLQDQRIELGYTSKYFREYVKNICIPKLNKILDSLEDSILHLERKRCEDEEFTIGK